MFQEIRILKIEDLYLVPICLLILFAFANRIKSKYKRTVLEKYFMPALAFRFFSTVVYTLVLGYYYKGGDTTMFFRALLDLNKAVTDNSSLLSEAYLNAKLDPGGALNTYFEFDGTGVSHYYMYQVGNYMVPKVALPLSFIFDKSYLCISFCLAFFAFGGCWRLFKLFYSLYPHLHKKIAVATLFLPSVLFWSSSLIKDSITMGALGFFVYAFYKLFFKKEKVLANTLIVISSSVLLFYIKPYILLCAIPAFLVWAFFLMQRNIRDKGIRTLVTLLFALSTAAASAFFMQRIASSELASQYATQNITKALAAQQSTYAVTEDAGSSFKVGEFDGSIGGLIAMFPLGIVTTLFRPFLWEVRSPIMAFTAFEGLLFLWFTITCFRFISFRRFGMLLRQNPSLIFCLVYTLLFAGMVGMSTLNFGTLARYKIPTLPFFTILLFVLLDKIGKAKPDVIIHPKIF